MTVPSTSGDISPPRGVRQAMEMQAEAERKKRAQILESEGNISLAVQIAVLYDGLPLFLILDTDFVDQYHLMKYLSSAVTQFGY